MRSPSATRWTCTACGQLVPREWDAAQLATAPAYTFRVPWADGGRCDKANARLAHYGCATFADPCLARALARVLIRDLAVRTRASRTDTHCLNGHRLAGDDRRSATHGPRSQEAR